MKRILKNISKAMIISLTSVLVISGCGNEDIDQNNGSDSDVKKTEFNKSSDSSKNSQKDNQDDMNKDSDKENDGSSKKQSADVFEIKNGQMLERDIIPGLAKLYGKSEDEVKNVLSKAESSLINPEIKDWRKMEGIIIPGSYGKVESLESQINQFIKSSEDRYSKIESEVEDSAKNTLSAQERIVLASMIEAECLAGDKRQETANVFLNRLDQKSKLQSCVTAEYALGYQRPYLTFDDIEIDSDYNTYQKEGLPIGPISSFSDESLKLAIGKSTDESINYFFYDYVTGEMQFYSDFEKFDSDGKVTMDRFDNESKEGKFDKINKQDLYGK